MVLVTGWAILVAGVIGLNALDEGIVQWRRWLWLGAAIPAALGIWCLVRAAAVPQALRERLAHNSPQSAAEIIDIDFLSTLRAGFRLSVLLALVDLAGDKRCGWLCIAGVYLCRRILHHRRGYFRGLQRLTAMRSRDVLPTAADPHANQRKRHRRSCSGVTVSPACLTEVAGLLDVRGYDATDPARLLDLCQLTRPDLLSKSYAARREYSQGYLS